MTMIKNTQNTNTRLQKVYSNFAEAKAHFRDSLANEESAMTLRINAVLLTPRTPAGHVKKVKEAVEFFGADFRDLMTESRIKSHLNWMSKRGFSIKVQGSKLSLCDYVR